MSATLTQINDLPDIARLVPHAAPMILLDRVTMADAGQLAAEVLIRTDSLFHHGNGVGAWVGIEYMAQAIAAWAGYQAMQRGEAVKIGFLLGARRYTASVAEFATHQRLQVNVKLLLQAENGLGSFECAILDAPTQTTLAQATVSVFQPHDAQHYLEEGMA